MWPSAFAIMSFDVRDFTQHPGQRFPVHVTLPGATDQEGLATIETLVLEGEAFAQVGRLLLEVTIRADMIQPCRRCATPVRSQLVLEESFDVRIPPNAETIDLLEPVLHLVLSAHDPNILCREDCRGLCPTCGVDLNEHPDHRCADSDDDRQTLKDLLS